MCFYSTSTAAPASREMMQLAPAPQSDCHHPWRMENRTSALMMLNSTISLRRLSHSWTIIVLVALALAVDASWGIAEEKTPDQLDFLQKAPARWSQYLEFEKTLQGIFIGDRRDVHPDKVVTRKNRLEWKRYNGWKLEIIDENDRDLYRGEVICENSRYYFSLARKSEQDPWVIVETTKKPAPLTERPTMLAGSFALYMPGFGDLPDLVKSPGFSLASVVPEKLDGEEFVKATFLFSPEKDKEKKTGLRGGWLLLDPAHDWVIRKGEWDMEDRVGTWTIVSKHIIELQYNLSSSPHPIPKQNLLKGSVSGYKNDSWTFESHGTYDLRKRDSIPESEFTLTAFGLPEPYSERPAPTRWYIWFAVAGVVCVASGYAIRRLVRRKP
jgi:hypothetical protein